MRSEGENSFRTFHLRFDSDIMEVVDDFLASVFFLLHKTLDVTILINHYKENDESKEHCAGCREGPNSQSI